MPNKAFKTDSQRMAFFIPSLGSVFKVVWLGFVVALLTT
ncbi:putative membrane protein [Vibrio parahaemolyticus VPTS-2009]|nr:putative membrane protein [Vibrio parahaemolyticus VPTS-2009]